MAPERCMQERKNERHLDYVTFTVVQANNFGLQPEAMLFDPNQSISQSVHQSIKQPTNQFNSVCMLYDHLLFSSASEARHKRSITKQSKKSACAALSGLILKPCKQHLSKQAAVKGCELHACEYSCEDCT